MIEGKIEFIHRMRTKGVPHFRPVDGYPDRTLAAGAMIGNILECKAIDLLPEIRIENFGNHDLPHGLTKIRPEPT
uniref:Uncharacterized protein n=1 Tax=Candidatus Kentrum sp. TC TaxID=2126339 RepID=A0A450ZWH7_9GAMM|nr:MAG: hypothetical protein BECKTC1821F_GA0114240_102219 [Candidatus Kentron sp. TC]